MDATARTTSAYRMVLIGGDLGYAGRMRRHSELGSSGSRFAWTLVVAAIALAGRAAAFQAPELTPAQRADLKNNFALCLAKLKGPYGDNYCVCRDGEKHPGPGRRSRHEPLRSRRSSTAPPTAPPGRRRSVASACGSQTSSRATSRSGTRSPDHHDLVRGYVLEKYFTETNPRHKLAEMRAYGGLAGAEYEAAAAPRFFERYLSAPEFDDAHHYLLAYELQRRYYVRDDQGQIQKIRALAIRIQEADPGFKPLRDATHNQLSAALIPKLAAYRDAKPPGALRTQVDELIAEIEKLTSPRRLARSARRSRRSRTRRSARELSAMLARPADRSRRRARSPRGTSWSAPAGRSRRGRSSPADDRRLVDVAVTASALVQARGTRVARDPRRDRAAPRARAGRARAGGVRRRPPHRARACRGGAHDRAARAERVDLPRRPRRGHETHGAGRRLGAAGRDGRLRGGVGAVDVSAPAGARHRRRRPARLAAPRLRARSRRASDDFAAGGAADATRVLRDARRHGRARAEPGPRDREAPRLAARGRLRTRRDRGAPRHARRPRAGGRHPDAGRGQRALARAAPRARARHPERRRRARQRSAGSRRTTARRSSCSRRRAAASCSRRRAR